MNNSKWTVFMALLFLVVLIAGVKAADQRWLMAQEKSVFSQLGSDDMGPASSTSDQGSEEIAPATAAPGGDDEMGPATSAPDEGTDEMGPADTTPQGEEEGSQGD
jgi:hypothetical protein